MDMRRTYWKRTYWEILWDSHTVKEKKYDREIIEKQIDIGRSSSKDVSFWILKRKGEDKNETKLLKRDKIERRICSTKEMEIKRKGKEGFKKEIY